MSTKALLVGRLLIRVAIGVVLVIEVALGVGVLLQILAANPEAWFSEWALRNQDRFMSPFEDIFDDVTIGDSERVVDVSGLFAMAAYAALLIPLSLVMGSVHRRLIENEERERRRADEARQARIFGGDPVEGVD